MVMDRVNWIWGCAAGSLLLVLSPTNVGGQAAENPQKSAASQPTVATVASPPACHCLGQESSSSVAQIRAALASPLKPNGLDFTETPLNQVVSSLQDEYGIPIQLDVLALQDAGLDPEEPVTVNAHGISLKSALRLMLKRHQLTYNIQDEVLLITTRETAEANLLTCVYSVRDLVNGADDAAGVQSLIQVVTSCIASESWSENGGGHAEIRPLKPGVLVISQTEDAHDQIGELLEALRQIR
jgi:hypothetical protein